MTPPAIILLPKEEQRLSSYRFRCDNEEDNPQLSRERLAKMKDEQVQNLYYSSIRSKEDIAPSVQICIMYFLQKSACGPIQTSEVEMESSNKNQSLLLFRQGSEEVRLSYTFLKDVCDIIPFLTFSQLKRIGGIVGTDIRKNQLQAEIPCDDRSTSTSFPERFLEFYCKLAKSYLSRNLSNTVREKIPIKAFVMATVYIDLVSLTLLEQTSSTVSSLVTYSGDVAQMKKEYWERFLRSTITPEMLDALIKEYNYQSAIGVLGLTKSLREGVMGLSERENEERLEAGNQPFNYLRWVKEEDEEKRKRMPRGSVNIVHRIQDVRKIPSRLSLSPSIRALIQFYLGNVSMIRTVLSILPASTSGQRRVTLVERDGRPYQYNFEGSGEEGQVAIFSNDLLEKIVSHTPYLSHKQLWQIQRHMINFNGPNQNRNSISSMTEADRDQFIKVLVAFLVVLSPNKPFKEMLKTHHVSYLKYNRTVQEASYDAILSVFAKIGQCGKDHLVEQVLTNYNMAMENKNIRNALNIIQCNAGIMLEYTRGEASTCENRNILSKECSVITLGGRRRKR